MTGVKVLDTWLSPRRAEGHITVSDGDVLTISPSSFAPQRYGLNPCRYIDGSGAYTMIVDPAPDAIPIGGAQQFEILEEWCRENGEDLNDRVLTLTDHEDKWTALTVTHLESVDLHERLGFLDPGNWTVEAGTATLSGAEGTLEVNVQSGQAVLAFDAFPSLERRWDPPAGELFWKIDKIIPFDHFRFLDFLPEVSRDAGATWQDAFDEEVIELALSGIWWEGSSNHLTGSDHDESLVILDNWSFTWTYAREMPLPEGGTQRLIDLCQPDEGPTWRVRTVQDFKVTLAQGKYRIGKATLEFLGWQDGHQVMIPYCLRNSNDEPMLVQCSLSDGKDTLRRLPYLIYAVGAQSGIRMANQLSVAAVGGAFEGGIWGSFEGTTFPGSYANWEYRPGKQDSWGYTVESHDFPPLALPPAEIELLAEQGISLPQDFYGTTAWGVWLEHKHDRTGDLFALPRIHQFGAGCAHRMGPSMYHEFTVRKLFRGAIHGLFAEAKQATRIKEEDTGQVVDLVHANMRTDYYRSVGLCPYVPQSQPFPSGQTRRNYLVVYSEDSPVSFVSRELATAMVKKRSWVVVWEAVCLAPERHLIETGIDVKWDSPATAGTKLEGSNWTFEAGVARFYELQFAGEVHYEWKLDGVVVQDGAETTWWWDAPAEDRVFKLEVRIYDTGSVAEETEHEIYIAQTPWRRAG